MLISLLTFLPEWFYYCMFGKKAIALSQDVESLVHLCYPKEGMVNWPEILHSILFTWTQSCSAWVGSNTGHWSNSSGKMWIYGCVIICGINWFARFGLSIIVMISLGYVQFSVSAKKSRAHSMKSCHHNNPQTGKYHSPKQSRFLSLLNDDDVQHHFTHKMLLAFCFS